MLLGLKKSTIYGPVRSRRLGLSLGINALPFGQKACPFDCLYCQYGWTENHLAVAGRIGPSFPVVDEIGDSLAQSLQHLSNSPLWPSYLTFSGNGEPTLHPHFDRLVDRVIALRNALIPEAKTAVLSNSALVTNDRVRDALLKLDLRIMKLDGGSPSVFRRFNRPCRGIHLNDITDGLTALARRAPLTIQALFCSGKGGNFNPRNIRDWLVRIKRIRPSFVQIYSLDRPVPAPGLLPVPRDILRRIQVRCEKAGIDAGVF